MADVAKHAGVAPMTVSRALHDDPRVSLSTRVRVLASVAALGYRRNEVARSFRPGRSSDLLGLVVTHLANPFYAQLALGVESLAAEHGMTMLLGNTAEDPGREKKLVDSLVSRRVSGIIVVPAGSDHGHLRPSGLDGMPVVLAARPPSGADLDCVLVDDFGGDTGADRGRPPAHRLPRPPSRAVDQRRALPRFLHRPGRGRAGRGRAARALRPA